MKLQYTSICPLNDFKTEQLMSLGLGNIRKSDDKEIGDNKRRSVISGKRNSC